MSLSAPIITALVLGLVIVKTVYDLLIEPRIAARIKKNDTDLNSRLERRAWRSNVATTIFVVLTAVLSLWNIQEAIMSGQVAKSEFDALVARVKALEEDRPPGSAQILSESLSKIEGSIEDLKKGQKLFVTSDELKQTREELEESIEKATAELKKLRELVLQRRQVQGGS